jgi:hypothetical protein
MRPEAEEVEIHRARMTSIPECDCPHLYGCQEAVIAGLHHLTHCRRWWIGGAEGYERVL